MVTVQNYFEEAGEALAKAMGAKTIAEQSRWLDEAARLNKLAVEAEKAKPSRNAPASAASASAA